MVALSSIEAEDHAACTAVCEALQLRWILVDLVAAQDDATVVMCDNRSCIAIAKNPVFHARTKNIKVHYHFAREVLLDGILELLYWSINDNVADVFTKALPRAQLEHLIQCIGVGPPLGH